MFFPSTISGEALVEILKSLNDSSNRIKDWNYYFVKPCPSWSHVTCRDEHVIYLYVYDYRCCFSSYNSVAGLLFICMYSDISIYLS